MFESLTMLDMGGLWNFIEKMWLPLAIGILLCGFIIDQVVWLATARPYRAWGRGYRRFVARLDKMGIHLPSALRLAQKQVDSAGMTVRMTPLREQKTRVEQQVQDLGQPQDTQHTVYDVVANPQQAAMSLEQIEQVGLTARSTAPTREEQRNAYQGAVVHAPLTLKDLAPEEPATQYKSVFETPIPPQIARIKKKRRPVGERVSRAQRYSLSRRTRDEQVTQRK